MKYSKLSFLKRSNFLFFALLFLLFTSVTDAQVNVEQQQNITTSIVGPGLKIRNSNSGFFSELALENDDNVAYTLGVSGSTNLFFDNFVSTPYLFNGSNKDFFFWANDTEQFKFFVQQSNIASISDNGLILNGGKALLLQSPNNNEFTSMTTEDDGAFYLLRNGTSGTVALFIDDNVERMGVNTTQPHTDLHVLQSVVPVLPLPNNGVNDLAGLTIQSDAGSTASLFVHTDDDLVLTFNSIYRGYWSDVSGAYTAVSDVRTKENIESLEPILDDVLKLRPTRYNFKIDEESDSYIGFIAQEVEKVIPEIVQSKGGTKGLTYDDFAVLAIKAIQEQQDIINQLIKRIEVLESE